MSPLKPGTQRNPAGADLSSALRLVLGRLNAVDVWQLCRRPPLRLRVKCGVLLPTKPSNVDTGRIHWNSEMLPLSASYRAHGSSGLPNWVAYRREERKSENTAKTSQEPRSREASNKVDRQSNSSSVQCDQRGDRLKYLTRKRARLFHAVARCCAPTWGLSHMGISAGPSRCWSG